MLHNNPYIKKWFAVFAIINSLSNKSLLHIEGFCRLILKTTHFSGNRWLCVVLGLCTTSWFHDVEAQTPGITPVYSWGQLEFDYATEAERQSAIDSGEFIEGNPAPIDVDIHYSSKYWCP